MEFEDILKQLEELGKQRTNEIDNGLALAQEHKDGTGIEGQLSKGLLAVYAELKRWEDMFDLFSEDEKVDFTMRGIVYKMAKDRAAELNG